MATTIPLSSMNRIRSSKTSGGSLSNPTMNPAWTWSPDRWRVRTLARRSRFRFGVFLHSSRLSTFGVSIPTKTSSKPARAIISSSSGSSERLRDASVPRENGCPCSSIQPMIRGRTSFFSLARFPMKLSSTKNRWPRHPVRRTASISAITWSADLVRGAWPKRTVMSQNSQS